MSYHDRGGSRGRRRRRGRDVVRQQTRDTQQQGAQQTTGIQVNYATVELLKESQEVEFTDSSNGATDVLWEFGDGNTSEERNPIHTYTENGTFTVTFTGYNQFGESSTTQTIIVEGIGTETYLHEYEVED